MEYKGYIIIESSGHGKAVAGTKKTSSIQVRKPYGNGYLLKKEVRFTVASTFSKLRAIEKAKTFIDTITK